MPVTFDSMERHHHDGCRALLLTVVEHRAAVTSAVRVGGRPFWSSGGATSAWRVTRCREPYQNLREMAGSKLSLSQQGPIARQLSPVVNKHVLSGSRVIKPDKWSRDRFQVSTWFDHEQHFVQVREKP